MAEFTKEEKRWFNRLQKVLNECPSSDIGFFTTGDPSLGLYRIPDIGIADDDFLSVVSDDELRIVDLKFPNNVDSLAG